MFKPGQSGNPAGKPKGAKTKAAALLKDAIILAAEKAGGEGPCRGLVGYLTKQANGSPALAALKK